MQAGRPDGCRAKENTHGHYASYLARQCFTMTKQCVEAISHPYAKTQSGPPQPDGPLSSGSESLAGRRFAIAHRSSAGATASAAAARRRLVAALDSRTATDFTLARTRRALRRAAATA